MADIDHGRWSRAATVEDWDDDSQTTLPDTRSSANVAVKRTTPELTSKASYERHRHGSRDSGYSSKAHTVASDTSGPRRLADLDAPPTLRERERHPYAMAQTRNDMATQHSYRAKTPGEAALKAKKYKHQPGYCEHCDQGGWHSSMNAEPTRIKASRPSAQMPRNDDQAAPRITRRPSANAPRPVTMYDMASGTPQYQTVPSHAQVNYAAPLMSPTGWTTPVTPTVQYSPMVYSQNMTPLQTIPQNGPYVEQHSSYFDAQAVNVPKLHPPKPLRTSSMQSQPRGNVILHTPRSNSPEKATARYNERVDQSALKTSHSQDVDRAMMPPPASIRSNHAEIVVSGRPNLGRNITYTPGTTSSSSSSNRRSIVFDDESSRSIPSGAVSGRHASPVKGNHPPTSYRGPSFGESDAQRPVLGMKSASYTTPSYITKVSASTASSSSAKQHASLPRRTTLPTSRVPEQDAKERFETEAEAYQAKYSKRSSMTANELTAELLRKNTATKRGISERSETGSSRSHKSKASGSGHSSGGDRKGTRNSMVLNIDGMKMELGPDAIKSLKITTGGKGGGVNLDFGGNEVPVHPRQIERAPSAASRVSGHSASSDHNGARAKPREAAHDRDIDLDRAFDMRRLSHSLYQDPDPRGALRAQDESTNTRGRRDAYDDRAAQIERRQSRPRREDESRSRRRSSLYQHQPTRAEMLWRETPPSHRRDHDHYNEVDDDEEEEDDYDQSVYAYHKSDYDRRSSHDSTASAAQMNRQRSRSRSRSRAGSVSGDHHRNESQARATARDQARIEAMEAMWLASREQSGRRRGSDVGGRGY